ncbi:MAG TPA: glycerol-3-phosphate dehydrogenase/oxidase [Ktedonobacterales bacterium]|nr:glycerol-3-phosphate dehydrogenase/oxidase [Ktedonobacterales bacterium]
MQLLNAETRSRYLDRMASEPFDTLVIGGGVTGLGVALDAAARGYRVALVEKGDFASGTSSKSTKLVHGGIRYLPQFDFGLVHEALVERGILIQNAPYLVRPLAFVLPLYDTSRKPLGIPIVPPRGIGLGLMLSAGLWMYDLLAGRRGIDRHQRISLEQAQALTPLLKTDGLKETFVYWDAQTNDTRLVVSILRTAAQLGASLANYAEVIGFEKRDGRLTGARVRNTLTGGELTIRARHIVNAAGIFAERVAMLSGDESKAAVAPSKGIHLVVDRDRVGVSDTGIVLPETEDGRILFVIPWGDRAVIGTTDTGSGDLDHPEASIEDIDYLLRHVNHYLSVTLTHDDLISVFAGYRPLVRSRAKPSANLSRTHVVLEEDNGMVTIIGGKLTTYRRMAQDTVDVLAKRDGMTIAHPTMNLPLSGAVNWKRAQRELARRCAALGIPPDVERSLEWNYGRNALDMLALVEADPTLGQRVIPDLPFIRAEIVYACRAEMAMRLDDAIARRVRIELEASDRGVDVASEMARLMAGELGWTPDQTQAEADSYITAIRGSLEVEGLTPVGG